MKTKKNVRGWSLLQKTLLEVFESSVKWSVSCTELLAQQKAVDNKETLCFFAGMLLILASVLTAFHVVDLGQRNMFGCNINTIAYLIGLLVTAFSGVYVLDRSCKQQQGLDQDSLRVWDNARQLFHKIHKQRQILDTFSPSELIAYLDNEVRDTVKNIQSLQKSRRSLMDDVDKEPKAYLKDLMALVVRLEIMNTGYIPTGMCDNEETLYNARAIWFYTELFRDPDFIIPQVPST